MVELRPFRAIYPALLDSPVSPPSQANSPKPTSVGFLHKRTLNRPSRAARHLKKWLTQGLLRETPRAGYYLHRHQFHYQGQIYRRADLFVLCQIEPRDSGQILPHEHTLTDPADNLYQLLAQTQTYLSSVFCLYSDAEGQLRPLLNALQENPPLLEMSSEDQTQHSLFSCDDPKMKAQLEAFFAQRRLYIADGHHRYETAQHFARDHGQTLPAARYALMHLTAREDPGLLLLPYHRLIHADFVWPHWPSFLRRLRDYFELERLVPAEIQARLPLCPLGQMQMVLQTPETCWLLRRPQGLPPDWPNPTPSASGISRRLDLTVLHELILAELAGFPADHARNPHYISFSHDIAELQGMLLEEGGVAFYLNAPPVTELCAVAEAQEHMPPKSTYFYPKVPYGFLISRFDPTV